MARFERREVEEAWRHFVAVGDSGDWNAWADLHSEDGVWVEHHLGTFEGREAIRKAILEVMKPVPMMEFPVGWHAIDGDRVVFYPWQVLPDPRGGDEVYRFGCVTILEYAGEYVTTPTDNPLNEVQIDRALRGAILARIVYDVNEDLTFEVNSALVTYGDMNALIHPAARYNLTDNVEVELSGDIFLGPDDTFFGQYKDDSRVIFQLAYLF